MAANKTKKNTKKNMNKKRMSNQIRKKMKQNIAHAKNLPKPIYEIPKITRSRKNAEAKFRKNIQNGLIRLSELKTT